MGGERARNRTVLRISGVDRVKFLQGLVSNDLARLDAGLVYAAMLTPQGKYLADFFLVPASNHVLVDVHSGQSDGLIQRLGMYRLRSDVQIEATQINVLRGLGDTPDGALIDPRQAALGWRSYTSAQGGTPAIDWDAIRVAHLIPAATIELIANETYILEANFEALNGVDFAKGCYVGQEVTARMKHKTELRKGLARVSVSEPVPAGTPITANGKPVGVIYTQSGGRGIAHLRFDRAIGELRAGPANVSVIAAG